MNKKLLVKSRSKGKYSGIKSEFIKEKIKGRKWKDSKYIDDLFNLERWIIEPPKMEGWMFFNKQKNQYKKEFEIIFKEVNPKEWRKYLEDEKRDKKLFDKFNKEIEEEEKEDLESWKKLGGK